MRGLLVRPSPPLCFMKLVPDSSAIFPHIRRGASVHGSHERKQTLQAGHAVQPLQEAAPQHVVTHLHAVDGEHRALKICICERPDRVVRRNQYPPLWRGQTNTARKKLPQPSQIDGPASSQPACGTPCPSRSHRAAPSCFCKGVIVASMKAPVLHWRRVGGQHLSWNLADLLLWSSVLQLSQCPPESLEPGQPQLIPAKLVTPVLVSCG